MTRGYPTPGLGSRGARLPAARAIALPQLSASGVLRGVTRGRIQIPAPPSGSIPAAIGILVVGYALEWLMQERPGEEPGRIFEGGGFQVNPALTYWGERQGSWYDLPGYSEIARGKLKTFVVYDPARIPPTGLGPPNTAHFKPENIGGPAGIPPGDWQMAAHPPGTIPTVFPNWWFGISTHLQTKRFISWGEERQNYANKIGIWYLDGGETESVPGLEELPPRAVIPWSPSTWRVGRGQGFVRDTELVIPVITNPPKPGERGIEIGTPEKVNVLDPRRPELKLQMTGRGYYIARSIISQMGEAIDVTRCLMFATGNTYFTRRGVEKVIPKWRWQGALEALRPAHVESHGFAQTGPRVHSVLRGNNVITGAGKVLTPKDVSERLVKCLVLNFVGDRIIAQGSRALRSMGIDIGLTAGPFGVESLVEAARGGVPYDGALRLELLR